MRYMFFVVAILIVLSINCYVFYRIICQMPGIFLLRAMAIALAVMLSGCFFGSFLGRDYLPSQLLALMYSVGTSWLFISVYFVLIYGLLDLLRITHIFPLERFMFQNVTGLALVVGVVALIFSFGYLKYCHKERVELNLHVAKGERKETLKIVALSDMHLGYSIGKKEFTQWVELINEEHPDVVLIAGDIIDQTVRPLEDEGIAKIFRRIKSTHGIYAVMGNHEYISNARKSIAFYEEAGIHLLRDSTVLVGDYFYIVGRDDRSNRRRKPLAALVSTLDDSKPVILLDHQPYHLEEAEANGVDLQLSGHTHYGQIWPVSWITRAIYELPYGYKKKTNTHVYVTSGIGLWGGKFRIGTQSEYVVIHLNFER